MVVFGASPLRWRANTRPVSFDRPADRRALSIPVALSRDREQSTSAFNLIASGIMLCCCGKTGDEDLASASSTAKGITAKGSQALRQQGTPNLGDVFPDFKADTTSGEVRFHDWLGDS